METKFDFLDCKIQNIYLYFKSNKGEIKSLFLLITPFAFIYIKKIFDSIPIPIYNLNKKIFKNHPFVPSLFLTLLGNDINSCNNTIISNDYLLLFSAKEKKILNDIRDNNDKIEIKSLK